MDTRSHIAVLAAIAFVGTALAPALAQEQPPASAEHAPTAITIPLLPLTWPRGYEPDEDDECEALGLGGIIFPTAPPNPCVPLRNPGPPESPR